MACIRELLAGAHLAGDSAQLDAELLLCHCLQQSRSYLYTWPEREVDAGVCGDYCRLLAERRRGKPLAQLTREREFWSLLLEVDEHTLIPRPATETLVEWALALDLPAQARVADWGTGCGAIALALASERTQWQIIASDISAGALLVASRNGARLGLDQVRFVQAAWGSSQAPQSLELIVSNPPYIPDADPHLQRGDLRFEPAQALRAGADGLDAIRSIIALSAGCLHPGGRLLLEHGYDQATRVRQLLESAGFQAVTTRRDLAGHERISGGKLRTQDD